MHLSLVEKSQASLLDFRGTREEWLRHSLQFEFSFRGWGGAEYVWVPKSRENYLIFGLIQGKKPYSFHDSPEEGGDEKQEEFWQGAYVFLDPQHHEDGQKLAIENDVLGRPQALAKSLFDHISAREDAPFNCIPELIFDESDFWRFAEESGNVVKWVKFEFVVPNMWGPQNDLEEDLRDTGRDTGSDRVDVTFKGKNGVKTESEKVRDGVKYAGRGAGRVKARNFQGMPFSSDLRPTTVVVDDHELVGTSEIGLQATAEKVLRRG